MFCCFLWCHFLSYSIMSSYFIFVSLSVLSPLFHTLLTSLVIFWPVPYRPIMPSVSHIILTELPSSSSSSPLHTPHIIIFQHALSLIKRLIQMMCGLSDMLLVWKSGGESLCSEQLEGAFSACFYPFREYDITHREFPAACIFGHNEPRKAWQTVKTVRILASKEQHFNVTSIRLATAQHRFTLALMSRLTGWIHRYAFLKKVHCHEITTWTQSLCLRL